jgi:outer membrane murein-binding lipoprotein Lpp
MSTVAVRPGLGPAYSRPVRDLRGSGLLRSAAVGLLLGTTLLAGCSARTEANDTLPSTSSAPTTEAALPQLGPPDMPMPSEAREPTAEGADAFTRYYVELYNHAIRTLDTTHMRDFSQGCDTCDQLADQVDAVAAAGQRYEGGEARVVASTPPFLTGDEAQLVFDVAQAPLSVTLDGVPVEGQAMPEYSSTGGGGILRWSDDRATWVMTQWNIP